MERGGGRRRGRELWKFNLGKRSTQSQIQRTFTKDSTSFCCPLSCSHKKICLCFVLHQHGINATTVRNTSTKCEKNLIQIIFFFSFVSENERIKTKLVIFTIHCKNDYSRACECHFFELSTLGRLL